MNTPFLTELYELYKTLPTLQQAFLFRIYKDSPFVVCTGTDSRPCATELGDLAYADDPKFAEKLVSALDAENLLGQPYNIHPDFAFVKAQFDNIVNKDKQ